VSRYRSGLPSPASAPPPPGHPAIRAGVSGAAIAGAWTGVNEAIRVRHGEVTAEEALRATATSAAVGAAAGTVAHVATQIARSVPLLGLAAIALGLGAVYVSQAGKPAAPGADDPAEDAGTPKA